MKPIDSFSKWGANMIKNLEGMEIEKKLAQKSKLEKEIERRMRKNDSRY
ncbi:hypothetical protein LCGC14_2501590 [marine sediment metagenome]|uniref:Uncharacterized protein n=1 Tax=marine sediment metagenome TaxID=412755 RepID=A0A0F9DVF7_9ZZZZ